MKQVMNSKIQIILTESNKHLSAKEIAIKCHMNISAVYSSIRKMRLSNIGILTTNKGYILSEFATKTDDVNFMRRLYGRRTSDYIALKAAEPHIAKRWSANPAELKSMMQPLMVDLSSSKGMKFLLSCDK
jgi:DNA-binding transcriptional regulator GbsR (MarR family)